MKTNNVNYNSSPAFGTKLSIIGHAKLRKSFLSALQGGIVAQGRANLLSVTPTTGKDFIVLGKTDKEAFGKLGYGKNENGGVTMSVIKFFFMDADKIDLSKPLRFVIEGKADAKNRFLSALKGGLVAQEIPQGIAHNSKKTFIAIGEDAQSLSNSVEVFKDSVGVVGSIRDKKVEDFFKNAQVIHVTE